MKDKETTSPWPRDLRKGLISCKSLYNKALIGKDILQKEKDIEKELNIRVPASFLHNQLIEHPPIANQVIPSQAELINNILEEADPIGDETFSPFEGITHRYQDRILLKLTYLCAMYCRFCFRKNKVSHNGDIFSEELLSKVRKHVEAHPKVQEIILTGGDPLTMTDRKIRKVTQLVSSLPQIKRLRFHTRIPTALPSRITPDLIKLLKSSSARTWVVVHINSAAELSYETTRAISQLVDNGIQVLSQSVLLKGINTQGNSLEDLLIKLVNLGVKPYYLHYPDLAKGTNHFRIPLEKAKKLVLSLRGHVPGYAIPDLIIDIPGGHGKISALGPRAKQVGPNQWEFTSPLTEKTHFVTYPDTINE